jgi:hypothetical protein
MQVSNTKPNAGKEESECTEEATPTERELEH